MWTVGLTLEIHVTKAVFSNYYGVVWTGPESRFTLKQYAFFVLFFVRMPVLYERLGIPGRVLSSLFFLCLSLGGVSSLVAMIELPVHTLEEFKNATISAHFELILSLGKTPSGKSHHHRDVIIFEKYRFPIFFFPSTR